MAGSLNKVQIIGSLGRDPEVKSFANGGKIANLRVATSETWRDKTTGERKERTEWHSVSIQNEHLVNVAEQYLRKGSKVYVEGKLETRKWQAQDGTDRYSTEITLRPYAGELVILSWPDDGEGRGGRQDRGQGGGRGGYDQGPGDGGGSRSGGGQGGGGRSDIDDEIPF